MAREYQVSELSADEDALFDSEWDAFVTKHFRARETVDVFQDHKENIKEACRIAKYQLESSFGGLNANTNEFGWMPIMPNFLLETVGTPTYATSTWKQYISTDDVTTRWKNWIGSSDDNLKVSKYATLIMIAFADPSELPKIDGIQAKVKGKDYPIWYFGDMMRDTDQRVYELTAPIVVEKEQEFYLQQLCGRAGVSELHPLGVYFAKGDHMRDQNAYARI